MEQKAAASNRRFGRDLARAFGGAILFSLPLLMTMEMWWLGGSMPTGRFILLLAASFPLLVGLSHLVGFEETFRLHEDALDAFVALGVGFAAGAIVLTLLGVIEPGMPPNEIVGKVALQAVPGAFGALLARSQFHEKGDEEKRDRERRDASYGAELLIMVAGALFLALNIAPTEEIMMIAYRLNQWQLIGLIAASLAAMHAFVYALGFSGQAAPPEGTSVWSLVVRFTVPGYAIALLISFYVLWSLGRTIGLEFQPLLAITIVLGFPAALGAAAARLIL